MTLRERASVVLAELIGQGTPQSPAWLDHLEAFAQQVQEEEREGCKQAIETIRPHNNGAVFMRNENRGATSSETAAILYNAAIAAIRARAMKEKP